MRCRGLDAMMHAVQALCLVKAREDEMLRREAWQGVTAEFTVDAGGKGREWLYGQVAVLAVPYHFPTLLEWFEAFDSEVSRSEGA